MYAHYKIATDFAFYSNVAINELELMASQIQFNLTFIYLAL